ncbi:MAG: hypothetical protein WDO13_18635 [Verrucomicrobiota bacterium]
MATSIRCMAGPRLRLIPVKPPLGSWWSARCSRRRSRRWSRNSSPRSRRR